MALVLVGFGQQNQIQTDRAKLIDLRTDKFDVENDRRWMAYMSKADCAVGVHGSGMLLPSGLAKAVVELVPRSKYKNTVQDLLFQWEDRDPRDALLFFRMLYGNETLSNVHPSTVSDVVASLLAYAPVNSAWYKAQKNPDVRNQLQSICNSSLFKRANTYFRKLQIQEPLIRGKVKRILSEKISSL